MVSWKGTKHTLLLVGAVALAILIGTGAVAAAQSHVGPFSSGSSPATHSQSSVKGDSTAEPTDEPTDQPKSGKGGQENDQELSGIIQSVDMNGKTFVLAPDNGSAAVTIAFDTNTAIDKDDEASGSNPLVVSAHVTVEVIKRTDGSLYAKAIELTSDSHGDGNDDGQGKSSGDDGDGGSRSGNSGGSDDGGSGY